MGCSKKNAEGGHIIVNAYSEKRKKVSHQQAKCTPQGT